MRIDIDKAGKETVTLTKAEQATFLKAADLAGSIGRHCADPVAKTTAEGLDALRKRYCPTSNGDAA